MTKVHKNEAKQYITEDANPRVLQGGGVRVKTQPYTGMLAGRQTVHLKKAKNHLNYSASTEIKLNIYC